MTEIDTAIFVQTVIGKLVAHKIPEKSEITGLVFVATRTDGQSPVFVVDMAAEEMWDARWLVEQLHFDRLIPEFSAKAGSIEQRWKDRQHSQMKAAAEAIEREMDQKSRLPVECTCGQRVKSDRGLAQHMSRSAKHQDGQ